MNKLTGICYLIGGFCKWVFSGMPLIDDDEHLKG
jgi:hypothetical protein